MAVFLSNVMILVNVNVNQTLKVKNVTSAIKDTMVENAIGIRGQSPKSVGWERF